MFHVEKMHVLLLSLTSLRLCHSIVVQGSQDIWLKDAHKSTVAHTNSIHSDSTKKRLPKCAYIFMSLYFSVAPPAETRGEKKTFFCANFGR